MSHIQALAKQTHVPHMLAPMKNRYLFIMYSLAPNLEEEQGYEAGPHLIAMASYI